MVLKILFHEGCGRELISDQVRITAPPLRMVFGLFCPKCGRGVKTEEVAETPSDSEELN
jgi:hypothetical protein